ncbi:MAG: ferrous iron transport protein B [Candidatus Accumulibacter sp. 66-26]|nr:ferrous iron transport protein B [Accumulibacter sp.]OJW52344.1 MAG: ferrous iron transport protein B [Candidatus Accumulibacter sp. 66-26]
MSNESAATAALPSPALSALSGLLLVGQPNVGKSVLFHALTGRYVTVSNYPGTTVEVSRGKAQALGGLSVLDTPGVISLPSRTGDEHATTRALLDEQNATLLQVGDAKNLRRSLQLAVLLAEMGRPMLLALNMVDEAEARGARVDAAALSAELGLQVLPTVATRGKGVAELRAAIPQAAVPRFRLEYPADVESTLDRLAGQLAALPQAPTLAPRALGLLFLAGDGELESWLAERLPPGTLDAMRELRDTLQLDYPEPLSAILQQTRMACADRIAGRVLRQTPQGANTFAQKLGALSVNPRWGWPILLVVLYAIYWFVGEFGAGTLVGLLEEDLFGTIVNPWFEGAVRDAVPWPWLSDLLIGPYGLWTMGMTYALALILPIVTTFFIAFGALEDSGYFSRLTVLSNKSFSKIGLNGRAVLPMVLGLGCVTMATLTTRILHSPREKLIVTFLLALAIPCSAQLGVVMGMLAGISFGATLIWFGIVLFVLVTVGWLANRVIKGRRIPLMTELPPLRLPAVGNVLTKTWARLKWYLVEVIPLFLIGSFLLYALDRIGALPWLIEAGEPLVTGWLGLPKEASAAFLMGFLRRDFGATGLFAMGAALSPAQMVVGIVTLTLFVPCFASLMMIVKEHGARRAALMLALIMPFAFFLGGVLRFALALAGWGQ